MIAGGHTPTAEPATGSDLATGRWWHDWTFIGQELRRARAVLPVGLGLLYASQRLFLAWFYDGFGVTVEEVGRSHFEGLLESVVLFVVAYVLINIAVFVIALDHVLESAHLAARAITNRFRSHPRRGPAGLGERGRRRLFRSMTALHATAFLLVLPAIWLVRDTHAARAGEAVHGFPVVVWRADPATIAIVGAPTRELAELSERCLLYLGRSNGVSVLYDPATGRTHRIATSSITVGTTGGSDC